MKLFKFYPETYVRQYAVAESREKLMEQGSILYDRFIRKNYDWVIDDADESDEDVVPSFQSFMENLYDAEESDCGTFIDSHY